MAVCSSQKVQQYEIFFLKVMYTAVPFFLPEIGQCNIKMKIPTFHILHSQRALQKHSKRCSVYTIS